MSIASPSFGFPSVVTPAATTRPPNGPPVVIAGPVLIGDCVTPLAGETLLSLLWTRLARDD
jgi:hypothetical protein